MAPLFGKNLFRVFYVVMLLALISSVSAQLTADASAIIDVIVAVACSILLLIQLISAAIASLMIVWAGTKYVYGANDPGVRKQCVETIKAAIIGLIIIVVSKGLVNAIVGNNLMQVTC